MLAVIVHLIDTMRRLIERTNRAMNMVAETLDEALAMQRAARKKHPFAE